MLEIKKRTVLSTAEVRSACNEYEETKSLLNTSCTPPPTNKMLIPFHYLRALAGSMKEGATITPGVHIPKAVWTQNCEEIISIAKKCQMFKTVAEIAQRYAAAMQKGTITTGVPHNNI